MDISPEQWRALNPLLDAALDIPLPARDAWLAQLDTTQPELSPLLRRLLAADERAEQGLGIETVSTLAGSSQTEHTFSAGQQIGSYRLLRPLGRGGMGEVWLARQAEGGITREVALKLPMLLGPASLWRERFRRERDILARLLHPNIAALFDAGLGEAGAREVQPYLAMEYIEGRSLIDHANESNLTGTQRLALFRQVLAAVAFAHRQFVVHRDLKPANILVNAEGQVKLLDFGIAKLLDDESADSGADDLTRMGGRLLTLRYAAPEQLQDGVLSTATDVYALGVILHELLTGQSPYARARAGHSLLQSDLLSADFVAPSALAPGRGLRGDLDAILLKAMRADVLQRYGTVEQFDDDLQRYLERRPVLARRGNWRYSAGRFVVRNRLWLVAASVVLASLVVGLVVVERERRIALAEKARAERHFASVRELANTFIYDIEEDLRGLAGTLPVREKLARTSVKYLDTLASESRGDATLMAEVGGGYRHLGEVFNGGGSGAMGDTRSAIQNLEKAARLLDGIRGAAGSTRRVLDDRMRVHYQLGTLYVGRKDPRMDQEWLLAIQLARALAATPDAIPNDHVMVPGLMLEYINVRNSVGPLRAQESALMGEVMPMLQAAQKKVGTDLRARGNLAMSYFTLAEVLRVPGASEADLARGLAATQAAQELMSAVVRDAPDDVIYAGQADQILTSKARTLLAMDRAAQAEVVMADVLTRSARRVAQDPQNVDEQAIHWDALLAATETAFSAGHMATTRQRAAEVHRLLKVLPTGVRDRIFDPDAGLVTIDRYLALACQKLREEPHKASDLQGCSQK